MRRLEVAAGAGEHGDGDGGIRGKRDVERDFGDGRQHLAVAVEEER